MIINLDNSITGHISYDGKEFEVPKAIEGSVDPEDEEHNITIKVHEEMSKDINTWFHYRGKFEKGGKIVGKYDALGPNMPMGTFTYTLKKVIQEEVEVHHSDCSVCCTIF